MKAEVDVENLLRQDHIRPEDLLTDGPLNLNQQILTEDTTVGNTKNGEKAANATEPIRIRRQLYIVHHTDIYDLFMPFIFFGAAVLLVGQALLATIVVII